jgi:hypothetical protein
LGFGFADGGQRSLNDLGEMPRQAQRAFAGIERLAVDERGIDARKLPRAPR